MQGKIIKGIAGFYYVHVVGSGIYECKAKGICRKENQKPLVGDNVEIAILDEENRLGNVIVILSRKNVLIRPAVANVDQALVIFAITGPKPNFNLLDRFLIMMERQQVNTIICFNKKDMASPEDEKKLRTIYENCGCRVLFTSVREGIGLDALLVLLRGKTTVMAGPSGVGKSSILNILQPEALMETGAISQKIGRGKHTTRHSELIMVETDTYLVDTPGFSSLYVEDFEKEELKDYFVDFREYEPYCRFQGCVHINEPNCGVKEALAKGKISAVRYHNYVDLFQELQNKRRY